MLDPSDASALIIRVRLPAGLAALRDRLDPSAGDGIPPHVTLLYPFAAPEAIDATVRALVGQIAARHGPWAFRLVGRRRWPGTLYVAVAPEAPFRALQRDLAAAFPALPLYGGACPFTPHVTIVEGPQADDPALDADPAWANLPSGGEVLEFELIVRDEGGGPWRSGGAFPLRVAG